MNTKPPLWPIAGRITPQAASMLGELRGRRLRRDLASWCQHCLAPQGQKPQQHHLLLINYLQQVSEGKIDRLMVMMPPGSAKSTYASVLFPAWFMAQAPERALIMASHTSTLAEDFSRRVQNLVREHKQVLGYEPRNSAADLWYTTNGNRYLAAGVGGAVTGSRADLALIDDVVKSREEAESSRMRDIAHNWFKADLLTRLKPGGRIVLIMTRWHEDDLAGRLLKDEPERWKTVVLPAIAGEHDLLGRPPGDALWPSWQPLDVLKDIRRTLGERDFSALYQQNPRPPEGALFKTALVQFLPAPLLTNKTVRAWDLAATARLGTSDPDWTVGVRMTRTEEGKFIVDDVVRLRGAPDEVEAAIIATASRDGRRVPIRLPQDPGQAGKAQILYLTRKLAGYSVQSQTVSGDKSTRAAPLAAQVNVGNVALVRAGWNRAFIEELNGFPASTHDDQVDAAADAFAVLAGGQERGAIIQKLGY